LISPDTNVFTVYLLQLYSQHAAAINVVAAGSVMLVFFIAASLAILRIFERVRR
jgi:ABC-type Fe3+ transport system permease subunit